MSITQRLEKLEQLQGDAPPPPCPGCGRPVHVKVIWENQAPRCPHCDSPLDSLDAPVAIKVVYQPVKTLRGVRMIDL